MLDVLDNKIIVALQKDARSAFADIAKELAISPGLVQARFSRMRKNGVIKGSTLILDIAKMGEAFSSSIGIEAVDSELEEVNNYVKGLKIENTQIFSWITIGRYNISTGIFSKNLLQAHRMLQLIKQHPSVLKVSISLSNNTGNDAIIGLYGWSREGKDFQGVYLDEIDREIISILCGDARTPFNRIAKTLGVGKETVFRRFRKLQKKGIILGSTVILSSKALGFQGLYGLFIKLKIGSSVSILNEKLKEIIPPLNIYPTWGEYDFYTDFFYKDLNEINSVIDVIRKMKEIMSIEPMMYALPDWSIPFIPSFEAELAPWAFTTKK